MKLLDTYCKAGGCSKGYADAGFEVVGVDIEEQDNYPFDFYRGDAIEFIKKNGGDFDVIHASPPCQAYSVAGYATGKRDSYPDLVQATRTALESIGRPWIIENVPGAPLRVDLKLCGYMFGLKVIRERWFELGGGLFLMQIGFPNKKGTVRSGDFASVFGKGHYRTDKKYSLPKFKKSSVRETWRYAMGIDWMNELELSQAIPPKYTEYIGRNILPQLKNK